MHAFNAKVSALGPRLISQPSTLKKLERWTDMAAHSEQSDVGSNG